MAMMGTLCWAMAVACLFAAPSSARLSRAELRRFFAPEYDAWGGILGMRDPIPMNGTHLEEIRGTVESILHAWQIGRHYDMTTVLGLSSRRRFSLIDLEARRHILRLSADNVSPYMMTHQDGSAHPLILGIVFYITAVIDPSDPSLMVATGHQSIASNLERHYITFHRSARYEVQVTSHYWVPIPSRREMPQLLKSQPIANPAYHRTAVGCELTPEGIPLPCEPLEGETFTLMSYNIWNVNAPWGLRSGMICGIVAEQAPQFITWQEVRYDATFEEEGMSRFQIKDLYDRCRWEDGVTGKKTPWHFTFQPAMTYTQDMPLFQHQMEGPAMFSRFPILMRSYKLLRRDLSLPGDDHQRACLGVAVRVPALGVVNIFTTHLTLVHSQQLVTVNQIYGWIKKFERSTKRFWGPEQKGAISILTGDLNNTPDGKAVRFLVGEYKYMGRRGDFEDIYNPQNPNTFNAFSPPSERKRIDFILLRTDDRDEEGKSNIEVEWVDAVGDIKSDDTPPSDHLAVVARFRRRKSA